VKISVIVPAYRAARTIEACIDALLSAGFRSGEIVVVDDGSTDNTVALVRAKGIEPVRLKGNQGAAQARNAGARQSDGNILFFVDSDVLVYPNVRSRLETFFAEHPDHAGVFGSYDDAPPTPTRVSRVRNLLHHHVHQMSGGPISSFWTGCGALRRADFEAGGGFRTGDEMIEDVGLGLRLAKLGRPVIVDPEILCTHLKQWTWGGFARTDYRHRAIPWTRMMLDPANRDLAHILNAGARGKAAVIAVGLSLVSLPLALFFPLAGLAMAAGSLAALVVIERSFLKLVARLRGLVEAVTAVGVLWVHYLTAGAGYARVRLLG
jgi:glycosyltransferase involved in cell wall biosynthesis